MDFKIIYIILRNSPNIHWQISFSVTPTYSLYDMKTLKANIETKLPNNFIFPFSDLITK